MNREEQLELIGLSLDLTDCKGVACNVDYHRKTGLGKWMTVYLTVDEYAGLWTVSVDDEHGITPATMISLLQAVESSVLRGR